MPDDGFPISDARASPKAVPRANSIHNSAIVHFNDGYAAIFRIDEIVGGLADAVLADHRHLQALRIADVVETETAFYAQAVFVRGSIAAADRDEGALKKEWGKQAAESHQGARAVLRIQISRGNPKQYAAGEKDHGVVDIMVAVELPRLRGAENARQARGWAQLIRINILFASTNRARSSAMRWSGLSAASPRSCMR